MKVFPVMTATASLCNTNAGTRETGPARVPVCFTQLGFLADVYLDDFYGADLPARASTAFTSLKQLLQELGLQTSPDKDSPPSTKMVCLGIDVDSEEMSPCSSLLRTGTLAGTVSLVPAFVLHKEAVAVITGKTFVRHCLRQTGANFHGTFIE